MSTQGRRISLLLALALAAPLTAQARDTIVNIPLADVLAMPEAQSKLDGSVKFYLAGQKGPKVARRMGTDTTSKKTNAFNKSDEEACRWVALSALIDMQKAARKAGADAVVDIVSNYQHNETRSDTTVECHAGGVVAGVALKGTQAKLAR